VVFVIELSIHDQTAAVFEISPYHFTSSHNTLALPITEVKALVSVSHQRLSIGKGKKDQSQACPRHLKGKAVFIRPELEFSQWRDVQVKIGLRRQ